MPSADSSSLSSATAVGAVTGTPANERHPDQPLRDELLGPERLESRARELAAESAVEVTSGKPLLRHFERSGKALRETHQAIVRAYHHREIAGGEADWLLDNFHVVEEALHEATINLPVGYYRKLPKLVNGLFSGFPRVYALAVDLISHCDSALDEANVLRFVSAYQSVTPLTIGELWALPTMLRWGLLDNLRRLARQILRANLERQAACQWLQRCMPTASGPDRVATPLPESCSHAFVFHLAELLRGAPHDREAIAECLEANLASRGASYEEVQRHEQQRQAANQVSIGNCVTSLRLIAALDWAQFFERVSVVETLLNQDPSGIYPKQDFATRDRCRQVIEQIARGARRDEAEVTTRALELARSETDTPRNFVGYFLLGDGRECLEHQVGYAAFWSDVIADTALRHPCTTYFALIIATSLTLLLTVVATVWSWGAFAAVLFGVLLVLPVSELAIQTTNWLLTLLVPPRVLPRLEYLKGLPPDCATFIVIPGMLNRPEDAKALLDRLEIHYLATLDTQFRFALLTDFSDAPTEQCPEDQASVRAALDGVRALNGRYRQEGADRFFVLHRRRRWNPAQGCWMGWERKRGKLLEFNRLLRGDRGTSYAFVSGDLSGLPQTRYVITLDADTQLPREAAARMVATLAHPLNQPQVDTRAQRVVAGYGLLQPRVSFSLATSKRSGLTRLFTASAGLDPYTTACSDVYQDLFGLGSFTGKGIYQVDAFEAAVGSAFPENQILSHDLIEGNYARCGLATDIELLDDFPARYLAYARREHRWVRGDWQIAPWLLPKVPAASANGSAVSRVNTLAAIERWKILDNLRRSLVPPALLLFLIAGWICSGQHAWMVTLVGVLTCLWPALLQLAAQAAQALRALMRNHQPRKPSPSWFATIGQGLLSATLLVDQAQLMTDAIGRTLWRMLVTRRRLLEWETAATAERRFGNHLWHFVTYMGLSLAVPLLLAQLLAGINPSALVPASPLLLAWTGAPVVAWWLSQPTIRHEIVLSPDERSRLRLVARKTWSFFETFVTAQDHALPPDNFQEFPKGELAHRTSPTNIGLYLLSNLAARDFRFQSTAQMVRRLEATFATLRELPKHEGHLLNWYDTQTLRPLMPAYVSTVDSGNLLACLLVLKQGLNQLCQDVEDEYPDRETLSDLVHLTAEAIKCWQPGVSFWPRSFQHAGNNGEPARVPGFRRLLNELAEIDQQIAALSPGAEQAQWLTLQKAVDTLRNSITEHSRLFGCDAAELDRWPRQLLAVINERCNPVGTDPAEVRRKCAQLANEAARLAEGMNFRPLYNQQRHLFSVGLNLTLNRLDSAHYDLLASEACLTSFLAVARGDAPRRHWFQLARPLTRAGGAPVLVSWSGTMFEYLMPRLFLPSWPGTLLHESQLAALDCQIRYGQDRKVPWGVSESAFSATDAELNYQYQAFGVPDLGFKRGLSRDLVVAPYACLLAAPVMPRAVLANLAGFDAEGAMGTYGYYEAIDYTHERLPEGAAKAVVKCFMAHHQGMVLAALANCLLGDIMVRRLRAEPMIRATELLLQERLPSDALSYETQSSEVPPPPALPEPPVSHSRRLTSPHTAYPRTHLLAGGDYRVMVTNSGSSRSQCGDLDVLRWREDPTCDATGLFLYIRDLRTRKSWAAGFQPLGVEADEYEVTFAADKAEFRRVDGAVETRCEVTVSTEHKVEVRRLTLVNSDFRAHEIEITSYGEIVLTPHDADLAHPAFGKLFVETEFVPQEEALLCKRRPRLAEQQPIWALHVVAADPPLLGPVQYETDRDRFLGRGRTPHNPAAMDADTELSRTVGPVLDPLVSLRCRVRVPAKGSVVLGFTTGLAGNREEAIALADQYHDLHAVNRTFDLAWAQSQLELRHLHLTAEETHFFQRLAGHLLFSNQALRAPTDAIAGNRQGLPALWRNGVSGDRPILIVRVREEDDFSFIRQLLAAHQFWMSRGLIVDMVVLNDRESGYLEDFQKELERLVHQSDARQFLDKPGGIFLRRVSHLPPADVGTLLAAARCVLEARHGSLQSQLDRLDFASGSDWLPTIPSNKAAALPKRAAKADEGLLFDNGWGGFTPDGREYVIRVTSTVGPGRAGDACALPPASWINVIANPHFGCTVSEAGSSYTWAVNSQTNRLTPWNNDPVCDRSGEALYLCDRVTRRVWTPTPLPRGTDVSTRVRHGFGYSAFEQVREELRQEVTVLVHAKKPVKIVRLKLENRGNTTRRLSAVYFAEWVLGAVRDKSAAHVVTWFDPETGAVMARNPFNPDFGERVAFLAADTACHSFTGNRAEFIGRNGMMTKPQALEEDALAERVGPALDPCAALQVRIDLRPGEHRTICFLLGQETDENSARNLIMSCQVDGWAEAALRGVRQFWERLCGTIQVETPNPALNLLVNGWLLYQVLSCRVWGRTALYQSGGAFGFRDQLQDVLALLHCAPGEARSHLLRAAGRQFEEGDVQHWWHVPTGAGVRTRFSDDFLWLPFAVGKYVEDTGDDDILNEPVSFLRAPTLRPDQEDDYRVPERSDQSGSLYEHCLRAVEHGCRFGPHGLPLMGAGDWNDGMNRVGFQGVGESVWNGWFLLSIFQEMARIVEVRGEPDRAASFRKRAEALKAAIEEHGWDGRWYRRAYFDDGTPLGSAENAECKVDSLPQSWAALTRAGDPERVRQALAAVEKYLVLPREREILLFTPPFDHSSLEPGYVKGYVPGIRENGGQYTHAALWFVQALTTLGSGSRAEQLLNYLNPITHASTRSDAQRYRVEPYVVAADVGGVPPHTGRGGWTWYTGSAAWFYRIAVECVLGFTRRGNRLLVRPCIPTGWRQFSMIYRHGASKYRIQVLNPNGHERADGVVTLDGKALQDGAIQLIDDGREHEIVVTM